MRACVFECRHNCVSMWRQAREGTVRVAIWPFWNRFLEIKWFGHLAFSWPFFNLEENDIFLGLFWLNFNETSNILWYSKTYLIYFGKFSSKIWPSFGLFHHLRIWPFFKLLNAKFGLFYFLEPGNPGYGEPEKGFETNRIKSFIKWSNIKNPPKIRLEIPRRLLFLWIEKKTFHVCQWCRSFEKFIFNLLTFEKIAKFNLIKSIKNNYFKRMWNY